MSAEAVVQRQLDAYNARDLARFVACYAEDVELFRPPAAAPFIVGRAALAEQWGEQVRMVFYDQRGHGDSGMPRSKSCTVSQLGRDLAWVFRQVKN